MSKVYVINCVKLAGKYHQAGTELDVDPATAMLLVECGAVTEHRPFSAKKGDIVTENGEGNDFINPFTDIELEDKHAKVLIHAGYTNMDELALASEEELVSIHSISKKLAKEIASCFKN